MLLKIQNVGKKQKTKKKNFKTTALPALSPHSPELLAPVLVWTSLSSKPRRGRKPGGRVALGTCSRSPPPLPVPGWVGCQVYLCTSCTLINLCKSPIPAPPCFCAFAHSPPTPRASPVLLLARGSGMDRGHLVWYQQGVPLRDPHLLPASPVLFTTHQGELGLPGTGRW